MSARADDPNGRRRFIARLRLRRKPLAWLGFALTAAGVAIVASPAIGVPLVGMATGWLLWFAGCAMFLTAVLVGTRKTFLGALVASFAAVTAGVFMHFHPAIGAMAASLLIAAVLIVDGALWLALALQVRPIAAWRWLLASAIASAIAGLVLATGAGGAEALQALLFGTAFVSSGFALLAIAYGRLRFKPNRRMSGEHRPAKPARA